MSAPSVVPLGLNLDTTIGALLLGGLVSAMYGPSSPLSRIVLMKRSRRLYGITSTQTVVYYQREHGDRWLVKGVVLVLW